MQRSIGKRFLPTTLALVAATSLGLFLPGAAESDNVDSSAVAAKVTNSAAGSAARAVISQVTGSAGNTSTAASTCAVTCNDPHPACRESARVIDTLNKLTQLINDGKFDAMGDYFDDGVTTFNEDTNKLIIGKEAVLADIKQRYQLQHKADGHLLSYTIDRPYAEVTGNRAVVNFVAKKVLSGLHPVDMESHSTEVFVKDGDKWKTLHYRGAWKKVSS